MRIGILSDTHDQVARTRRAVSVLVERGAQALIHCGDLTTTEIVLACAVKPAYFVFGNCDTDRFSLRLAIEHAGGACLERGGEITLAGRRLGVTHGDFEPEIRRLLSLEPDFLFSGHTHQQKDEQEGRTRWINPGALHRASTWTVVLVDLTGDHVEVLPILNDKDARLL
jgi:putative phosphoesterase